MIVVAFLRSSTIPVSPPGLLHCCIVALLLSSAISAVANSPRPNDSKTYVVLSYFVLAWTWTRITSAAAQNMGRHQSMFLIISISFFDSFFFVCCIMHDLLVERKNKTEGRQTEREREKVVHHSWSLIFARHHCCIGTVLECLICSLSVSVVLLSVNLDYV